jgi:hypothetical protein
VRPDEQAGIGLGANEINDETDQYGEADAGGVGHSRPERGPQDRRQRQHRQDGDCDGEGKHPEDVGAILARKGRGVRFHPSADGEDGGRDKA